MAVLVTDNRTVLADADSAVPANGSWNTAPAITPTITNTTFVESTNAAIGTLNIATGQFFFTLTTPISLVNTLIYVWSNNYALQNVWDHAAPPNAMHIGDGTNRISFKMAGSDRKVFSHLTSQDWNWDCLLLDMSQAPAMDTAGHTLARAGSFAALTTASITQVGSDFTTLSKGLGGGTNIAVDIIRYGNDGIQITSGSTSNPGIFSEIVAEDRSTADNKAHGIIREYTTNVYGIQGPINFGTASSNTWFSDSNVSLTFEARNVSDDKYYLKVTGSTAAETRFILDNSSVATAGPWVRMDFSSPQIEKLSITSCTFRGLSGSVTFASDVTASLSHSISNTTFVRSGPIYVNSVAFSNNSVQESGQIVITSGSATGTSVLSSVVGQGSGSLLWDINTDTSGKLDSMTFTKGAIDNHAIEYGVNCPVSMSLFDVTFVSYGVADTSGSGIFNNSGKDIQITLSGGTTPTIRDAPGILTTLVTGLTTVTLTGLVNGTEVRVLNNASQAEIAGVESVTGNEFPFTAASTLVVDIVIHHIDYEYVRINEYTIPSTATSIPIEQRFDRNYNNP